MKEQSVFEKVFGSEDTREIQLFRNEELDLQMRTVLNGDGSISVNAEDTAIGFGWVTVAKSGNEVIRWQRFNDYCRELGFPTQVRKETYIPESLYYLLAMKANNRKSQKFQRWLAMEVIPEIRKTGSYGNTERTVTITEPIEKPSIYLEASKIMSGCLESNRPYVLNILRHIVPDVDQLEVPQKVTKVKTEVKGLQDGKRSFFRLGVDIDTHKLAVTMAQKNLSKYEVAKRAQVCVNTVEGWLNGEHKPVLQNRINLCMAIGEDEDYLTPRRSRRRQ